MRGAHLLRLAMFVDKDPVSCHQLHGVRAHVIKLDNVLPSVKLQLGIEAFVDGPHEGRDWVGAAGHCE